MRERERWVGEGKKKRDREERGKERWGVPGKRTTCTMAYTKCVIHMYMYM